uniref:Chemokine interleukin-8-like domain-containing protein n=1 Tax=Sinocyclocheilus anshuiensis TaxID=1608454 RepID=A0A671SX39_9TELE
MNSKGSTAEHDLANSICCFNETSKIPLKQMPLKRLESYFWTSSSCPFKHIKKEEIQKNLFCMDPDYKWVQRAIKYLDTYLHK